MQPANRVDLQSYLAGCEPPGARRRPAKPGKAASPPIPPLTRDEALRLIDGQLASPLPSEYRWIERVTPPGQIVVRFVLPAELCRRENQRRQLAPDASQNARNAAIGIAKREREDLLQALYSQWLIHSKQPTTPLPGRPWIRAVKFGGHEPDPGAGWIKAPIDLLTVQRRKPGFGHLPKEKRPRYSGLGIVRDDRGSLLGRAVWWEPWPHAPTVLLEVWTGDAE